MSVIKAAKMSLTKEIEDVLDAEYHRRVPHFPEIIKPAETDDFIAWKMGLVPVKARGFLLKLNISLNYNFRQTSNMQ